MEELFKHWAETSKDFKQFNLKFCLWLITQEVDPDNCYPEDELLKRYNKYRING